MADLVGRGSQRISQSSPGLAMFAKGGVGYLPRRNTDAATYNSLTSLAGIQNLARRNPLELLFLLADMVPELSYARWIHLRLACSPGTVRLKAMSENADGDTEEVAEGTQRIKELFDSQPQEIGDFWELLGQNYQCGSFTAMSAVECVLDPTGFQVVQIWPIDPLTLEFEREPDQSLALVQMQQQPLASVTGSSGNRVPLDMSRTFWNSIDRRPGYPYGNVPFGPALSEILIIMSFIRDLLLAWHRVGSPKYDIEIDYKTWGELATLIGGKTTNIDIEQWVFEQKNRMIAFFNALQPDDAFFHAKDEKVNVAGGAADFGGTEGVFKILRSRLIQALKMLPTLMGVQEGTTETWAAIEWQIFTEGLKALISIAVSPLVDAVKLDFKLSGKPWTVELEFEPIRTAQRLNDAQAETAEIANEVASVNQGWQTNDEASIRITGSAAVSDPTPPPMPPGLPLDPNAPAPPVGETNPPDKTNTATRNQRQEILETWRARRIAAERKELAA